MRALCVLLQRRQKFRERGEREGRRTAFQSGFRPSHFLRVPCVARPASRRWTATRTKSLTREKCIRIFPQISVVSLKSVAKKPRGNELGLFSASDEINDLVRITESKSRDTVGTTVIDGNSSGGTVTESGTWKCDVRDISDAFIKFLRRKQIGSCPSDYFPRLIKIKQSRSETVMISAAGGQNPVIEEEPSLACFDGYRDPAPIFVLCHPVVGLMTCRWYPQ